MNRSIAKSLLLQFIKQEQEKEQEKEKEKQSQNIRQKVENTVTGMRARMIIGGSKILIISVSSNLFSDGENITYSFKGPDDKEINLLFSPNIDDPNVLNFNHESNFMFCLDYVDDGKNDEITLKFGQKNKKLNFKPVDKKYWMIKIEDENFFDNDEITEVQQYTGAESFVKKIVDYQVVKEIELNIKNIFTEMQKLEEQFKEVLRNYPALTSEQEKLMSDLSKELNIKQETIQQFYYKMFTEQNLLEKNLNKCQMQVMKNKYLKQYTTENVMDEDIRNQIAERVVLDDRYYIFFLVQSNLLDNEKEICLSLHNNYCEDTLKLSKDITSSTIVGKFEYDNYIVFSIPVKIDSFKLTLTDLKSDKSKQMSVQLYDYFQFYQIKIEDENFFTDENKQGILGIYENNLLLDNFFENIKNEFNKTYKEYIENCFRNIRYEENEIEIERLYTEIKNTYQQLIPSQNFTLQEIKDMQNSFVQKQNVIETVGQENVLNTSEQVKNNFNPNGFGISTIVAFLLTLTFVILTFVILTFATGLIPTLPCIITIAIGSCFTIGFGITFVIFKKMKGKNKRISKLEEVTLSPDNNDPNIADNVHKEEEKIPGRTNNSQEQTFN